MSEEPHNVPERDQTPRLRIRHLAQWTAWTAVILGLEQWLGEGDLRDIGWFFAVCHVTSRMISGAVLTGLTVCIWRWRRGMAFAVHPGEWLLAILGLSLFLTILFIMLMWPLVDRYISSARFVGLFHLLGLLTTLLQGGLCLLAVSKVRDAKEWRVFFVWLFLASAWSLFRSALFFLTNSTFTVGIPLFSVLLVWLPYMLLGFGVWADQRAARPRPWTHWVGVGAFLTLFVLSQITAFWIAYFPAQVSGQ